MGYGRRHQRFLSRLMSRLCCLTSVMYPLTRPFFLACCTFCFRLREELEGPALMIGREFESESEDRVALFHPQAFAFDLALPICPLSMSASRFGTLPSDFPPVLAPCDENRRF
ncbi:hypothetical protein FA13DRAFT_874417 [Coprinellus micaceus]|uniref:Uncharacterized protein n=1 Tax=Coprinellus micaceus TaxID=71717 RepID=A0A4Y7T1P0_COPMI|nr:hypothetical protein FA13DRAFT_874417 [Coprinellus micaceus]